MKEDGVFQVAPQAPTSSRTTPKCTTYIPTTLCGQLVGQKDGVLGGTGHGKWRATHDFLQSENLGLCYSLSQRLRHLHPDINGQQAIFPWGETFRATVKDDRSDDTQWLGIAGLEPIPAGYEHSLTRRDLRGNLESPNKPFMRAYEDQGTAASWRGQADH